VDAAGRQGLDTGIALDGFLAGVERRAFRMAEIATGNPDDALDIVQEAMLLLCKRYAQRDAAEWPPLFYRILQNRIRDFYRRQAVRNRFRSWLRPGAEEENSGPVDVMQTLADPAGRLPEVLLAQDDAMTQLQLALRRLPARQQEVFMLRTWEGLSVADTAQAMGCSAGSVKTHLSRALHQLREQLEGYN
jgi:RNA polymerase sigma-70 factor (ECF subfamily)